jgi:hypothetical protein
MPDPMSPTSLEIERGDAEPSDATSIDYGFDDGGVPWYLLLFYLSFLVFFTWYVLEYQLPEFLGQGPTVTQPVK